MAQETMKPKTYSVEEVIEITIRNLQRLWGNVPMRFKEMLADPLAGNIENLRMCYDAMMRANADAEKANKPSDAEPTDAEPLIPEVKEIKPTD